MSKRNTHGNLGKRISAAAVSAAVMLTTAALELPVFGEGNEMLLTIDGATANTESNSLYRGLGMVSGNNSSRLMLDYKAASPEKYNEIMNYIFGKDGIGITHLKLEMGSDVNSSSGTEPSVKRTEDEEADVTRGAGFQLAADAKRINPDLTLDMLWWSEPLWVSSSDDLYASRYKWYKETLNAAFNTYGLKFDYVSANQNERQIDEGWIKYLSKALKSETDAPYDYSAIKIVAADEVGQWGIAQKMLGDPEILEAVDVIGGHYNDWTNENVQKCVDEYGKEVWFSEGCPPMSYKNTYKYDGTGSGLSDINGMLDVANRIITMYPGGNMTLYQVQPVVAAYYDGVTYCQKQLITAREPWNGDYTLDAGYYMALHFSRFIDKGWAFVDSACAADGVAGGDGHAVVDAKYSYITAADTAGGDYSTVITNTTADDIVYNFEVTNLDKASSDVTVWETRGPSGGSYDENYFKNIATITPTEKDGKYTYSVTVKPNSLVTVSTVKASEKESASYDSGTVMALPYEDDYEYSNFAADFAESRGGAPLYTTDEGGAFEVVKTENGSVLTQKITPEIKAKEWGGTPDPVTNFGDDRWFNYSVSADVTFTKSEIPEENYTGVGMRYCLADSGKSGYWFQLYEDGTWKIKQNGRLKVEGKAEIDSAGWTNIKIEAEYNIVKGYIGGELVGEYDCTSADKDTGEIVQDSLLGGGRAALYSSYNRNSFDNLKIEPVGNEPYIRRIDDTDDEITYSGDWTHNTMSGFKDYNRTISEGTENAVAEIKFSGTGFAVLGLTGKETCTIKAEIDGETVDELYTVPSARSREATYYRYGLADGEHTVKLTVLSGKYSIDAVEIIAAYPDKPVSAATELSAQSTEAAETDISEAQAEVSAESADTAVESVADNAVAAATDTEETKDSGVNIAVPIAIGAGVLAAAGAAAVIIAKKKKK